MFLALTLALLGCSHRVTRPQLTNRTDRSLVVMTDSMLGGTFPQITDPARAWSHGSLIAASDAPLCVPDLKSRALTWDEVQTPNRISLPEGGSSSPSSWLHACLVFSSPRSR